MERFEQAALLCVGRGVGFGALAIAMVMTGTAFNLALSLKFGFILTLAMTAVLLWNHHYAPATRAERFEAWLVLPVEDRPSTDAAKTVFRRIIAETYLYFAVRSFAAAMVMMALWVVVVATGANVAFL